MTQRRPLPNWILQDLEDIDFASAEGAQLLERLLSDEQLSEAEIMRRVGKSYGLFHSIKRIVNNALASKDGR